MRTKMSKADATRTIEALFDDKGIIAGELKKGSKVQITGFGNFEARKRAARMGRNPKTGGVIQIKASIAPAFRAGKQLKMAVNGKKKQDNRLSPSSTRAPPPASRPRTHRRVGEKKKKYKQTILPPCPPRAAPVGAPLAFQGRSRRGT